MALEVYSVFEQTLGAIMNPVRRIVEQVVSCNEFEIDGFFFGRMTDSRLHKKISRNEKCYVFDYKGRLIEILKPGQGIWAQTQFSDKFEEDPLVENYDRSYRGCEFEDSYLEEGIEYHVFVKKIKEEDGDLIQVLIYCC